MKKIIAVLSAFVFSIGFSVCSYAQQGSSTELSEQQVGQMKKLQQQYTEEKSDLQIQLQKLQKDRDIAVKDKNTSLVERRNQEIKQTQKKLRDLPKDYDGRFSEMLTEEQKEAKVSDDFYAKELVAEKAKMDTAEKKEAAKPAAKPSPAKKKTTQKKAPKPAQDDEFKLPDDMPADF